MSPDRFVEEAISRTTGDLRLWVIRKQATIRSIMEAANVAEAANADVWNVETKGGRYLYGSIFRPTDPTYLPDGLVSVVPASVSRAFPHGQVRYSRRLTKAEQEQHGLVRILTDPQLRAVARGIAARLRYGAAIAKMGRETLRLSERDFNELLPLADRDRVEDWVFESLVEMHSP